MTRKDIRKLDQFVREQLRKRKRCERCGSTRFLQVSHIYSRRYLSIRFHPTNVLLFCAGCHLKWHHRPAEAVGWAIHFLGRGAWARLKRLANTLNKGLTVEEVKGWWTT